MISTYYILFVFLGVGGRIELCVKTKEMDLNLFSTIFCTLGGFEAVKWFINFWRTRKTDARKQETAADSDEFHLLRERLEMADKHLLEKEKQLYDKEQRFHEQTLLVRELQKQLLDKMQEIGDLKSENSALQAERALKLCERRGCKDRQPQSGY